MRGFWTRQRKKAARLVEHVTESLEASVEGDQVEQVAMLAGGGICLMFNCT